MNLTLKLETKYQRDFTFMMVLTVVALLTTVTMQADHMAFFASGMGSDRGLTGLMDSQAMRANSKYLDMMSWYGQLVSFAVTIICVVGLGQVTMMFFCTCVYYSNTHYWDTVDALKQGGNSGGFSMGQGNGGGGGGLAGSFGFDTIIDSFNKNMINIKRYSDCSTEHRANMNISEASTLMEWLIQKGPILLIVLLVLNMGWRGTLQNIFAITIDAGTVFFEALPYDNVVKWAEYKAAQETGYKFTLGMSGSEEGKAKEQLARQIFIKTQSIARLTKAEDIQALGAKCEGAVVAASKQFRVPPHLAQQGMAQGVIADESIQDAMWRNLKFSVQLSTTEIPQDVNQGIYIKLTNLAQRATTSSVTQSQYDGYYVVVAMRYADRPDEGIYTDSYTAKTKTDGVKQITPSALQ